MVFGGLIPESGILIDLDIAVRHERGGTLLSQVAKLTAVVVAQRLPLHHLDVFEGLDCSSYFNITALRLDRQLLRKIDAEASILFLAEHFTLLFHFIAYFLQLIK